MRGLRILYRDVPVKRPVLAGLAIENHRHMRSALPARARSRQNRKAMGSDNVGDEGLAVIDVMSGWIHGGLLGRLWVYF